MFTCKFNSIIFYQAMYRYACRLGLQTAYRDNEHVRRIIKMAIALALLPPGRAWSGYEVSDLVDGYSGCYSWQIWI